MLFLPGTFERCRLLEAACRVVLIRADSLEEVLAGSALYAAHVGDSRAVLCQKGRALRLTEDHKPDNPAERRRVQAAGRGYLLYKNLDTFILNCPYCR